MGTRGLLGLIIAAQRHGMYNHFDSYPDGLGKDIMKFILSLKPEEWDKMALLLNDIEWVDEGSKPSLELQKKYTTLGFCDTGVNRQSTDDWYCLLRKVQGAKALPEILNGNLKHMIQSVKFLEDGLFCEWAYFIDFEKRTFETWGYGKFLKEISFEGLSETEAGEYLEKMQNRGRWREEVPDSDDEEDKPESSAGLEDEEKSDDKEEKDNLVAGNRHEEAAQAVNNDVRALAIGK